MSAMMYLYPMLALMLLTVFVSFFLVKTRIGFLKKNKVYPHKVSTREKMKAETPDNVQAPSDNYENLFELPVLFYALCIAAVAAGIQSIFLLVLAWLFVVARTVHSVIHCTYNKTMHRAKAFFASFGIFMLMLICFAYHLLKLS